jgi:dTMP kinase
LLVERISALGLEVVATREPGGTHLGERIRSVLLEEGNGGDPIVDAMLFNAARRHLMQDVIRPAHERGAVIVCDRFSDSTIAYQGYGGGAALDVLQSLATIATGGVQPDRTVLLDVPTIDGLARRLDGAASELTRFETDAAHGATFHERVRNGYLELAAAEPARWRVVNASATEAEVAERVWEAVRDLFGD